MEPTAMDTSLEADRVQRAAWRRMGPAGRLALALTMSDDARAIAVAGVRARNPHASEAEAEADVQRRVLGEELFEAVSEARGRRGRG